MYPSLASVLAGCESRMACSCTRPFPYPELTGLHGCVVSAGGRVRIRDPENKEKTEPASNLISVYTLGCLKDTYSTFMSMYE